MKYIIAASLLLTSLVGYAQDTTPAPALPDTPEELNSLLDAPPVEEAPVAKEASPETAPEAAPVVEAEPMPEPKVEPKPEPVKLSAEETTPAPNLRSEDEMRDEKPFDNKASHWVTTFGFEGTKYTLPLRFNGSRDQFDDFDRELWGGRLGFGREIYLGGGLVFQGRLEGYYMGTLFEGTQTADPEFSTEVSNSKDTGQIFGADAIAHLGWMFDFKAKNPFLGDMVSMAFELFAEAGIGRGKSYQRYEYLFNASTVDVYDFKMEDDFVSQSVAAGINLLSTTSGFFMYLRGTYSNLDISERVISGKRLEGGAAGSVRTAQGYESEEKDPNVDPILIYALGGGYKF